MSDAAKLHQQSRPASVRRSRRFLRYVADSASGHRDRRLARVGHGVEKEGPTITLSFETAEGLQAGQSQLKFKEIVLGTVKSSGSDRRPRTCFGEDRDDAGRAEPLLTDTTTFWVVTPRLFAGNLSGLGIALLSGAYVGMLPGRDRGQTEARIRRARGPPVLETNVPGHTFLLEEPPAGLDFDRLTGILPRSRRRHSAWMGHCRHGGERDDPRICSERHMTATCMMRPGSGMASGRRPEARRAPGSISKWMSLRAVLLGGIAFETPDGPVHSAISSEDHLFPLFMDRDTADAASLQPANPAGLYFPGSVKGLAAGSEVTVHGLMIGHVSDVRLGYDPAVANAVVAPVHYEIQPRAHRRHRKAGLHKTQAEAVDALVKHGLRATLQSANLITGQQLVALDFVPDAPPASVTMEGTTSRVLPTTDSGGFSGLQASATELLSKVNTIPFDQIGKSLNGILSAVDTVANGGQMRQSLTGSLP